MSLIVLGATFCYALSTVMLRLLSRHDSDVVALFWLSLATSAASLVGAVPAWVWPTAIDWVWLIVMGLLGGIAQILNTRAWRLAPTVLAPFDYTSIVLAVLFGYLVQGGALLDGVVRPAAGDRVGPLHPTPRARPGPGAGLVFPVYVTGSLSLVTWGLCPRAVLRAFSSLEH